MMRLKNEFSGSAYCLMDGNARPGDNARVNYLNDVSDILFHSDGMLNAVSLGCSCENLNDANVETSFSPAFQTAFQTFVSNVNDACIVDVSGNTFLKCSAAEKILGALETLNKLMPFGKDDPILTGKGAQKFAELSRINDIYTGMQHSGLSGTTYTPGTYR